MNIKAKHTIKNISYTFISNIVALLISSLVVLIVPKLIGDLDYGYWQLYLFYSSYTGFLHFGWNDGIYLRYGGQEYQDLDKKLFFSQFYMLVMLQMIIAGAIAVASFLFFPDANRAFIFLMIAFCLLITNIRLMLLYILQDTNRIKEYSQVTVIEKILYCFLIVAFLAGGIREYRLMVVADLLGKLFSLFLALYYCKDIVFRKASTFFFSFKETVENINVGIKLMVANIASTLVIGVVRFGIERSWDVATFGKVSLTLSVSNLMMLFINTIGLVIFPLLRRTDEKKLSGFYITMRDFLMVIMFGVLLLYFPLRFALSAWLPGYADSLKYMAFVFPICVFEGKMALLINTYLKTLREEKLMLKVNVISVLLSIVLTFFTTMVLRNLTLAFVSIAVLLAFRCILAEILLIKILKIYAVKDILLESIMTAIFILSGWFFHPWIAVLSYLAAYVVYLVIKRKDIVRTVRTIKTFTKAN